MYKLFISYRSSDAAKVDKIARDLTLLQNADGTAPYTTWQDKHNLPPASPNWWDAIVDAIYVSEIFVFNVSRASLQSEVCQSELDYAHKLNLPIIPVVLDGEFFLDPKSGKYNIGYWDLVPDWLAERQFLFYVGAQFFNDFEAAVAMFEGSWPRRLSAQRPLNPDSKSVHGSNHALYDAACDYAERLAFADAEKHFDALVRRNDSDYADVAAQWLELIRLYTELIEIDDRPNARFKFKSKWAVYTALFPKEFLDGIFDPKDFNVRSGNGVLLTEAPILSSPSTQPVVGARGNVPAKPTSLSLMPAPFAWIDIPGKGYSIAKYPITNAQFAKFIEAGGYDNRKWWTDTGWKASREDPHSDLEEKLWDNFWTEPRFWGDSIWNQAVQPVVGVSWYEGVAFCEWLSDESGEKITLPTEDQWQYAAQGSDGREYPWGNHWLGSRCNNSVDNNGVGKTTSVRHFEGKGNSPFGVVDMVGNVWEWCLTNFDNKTNDINSSARRRVLRGGAWHIKDIGSFRCSYRGRSAPHTRDLGFGFRISRS